MLTLQHVSVLLLSMTSRGEAAAACCEKLSVSSCGLTALWWPHILGVYVLHKDHEDDRLLYKMVISEKYISRPSKGIKNFTWGVNTSPEVTWGWLRAEVAADCPEAVAVWTAWDKEVNRMSPDKSLTVTCLL